MNEVLRQIKNRKSTMVFEDKLIATDIKNQVLQIKIWINTYRNFATVNIWRIFLWK
jgi:hypothetical protein